MTDHTALMCPYKLGPCWEHGCQLWKGAIGDCGLKRIEAQDQVIADLEVQVEVERQAGDVQTARWEESQKRVAELEAELSSRPTDEELGKYVNAGAEQGFEIVRLGRELSDARQELETLRAQGGRKSRREKKPTVGEL